MVSTVNGKYSMAQFLKKDNNILLNEGVSIVTGKMVFLLFVSREKSPIVYLTGQNEMLFLNMQIENQPKLY